MLKPFSSPVLGARLPHLLPYLMPGDGGRGGLRPETPCEARFSGVFRSGTTPSLARSESRAGAGVHVRRVNPEEFQRCVTRLTIKLRDMAVNAGVPEDECTDLETVLAALPPVSRDRASVLLEGVRVHSEDKCMSLAAGFLLNLAQDVWNAPFLTVSSMTGFSRSSP